MGSCVFKAGYCLYAETCIGRCLHDRFITSFQRQFGENAMHSKLTPYIFNELLILPIPVLVNNYAYLVSDLADNTMVLVDVGDATIIRKLNVEPHVILTTHKHWDHSGGNRAMRAAFPSVKIYGGVADHVPDCTDNVSDGQELRFGSLRFTAMWTPGHTRGHIVWRLDGSNFGCPDSVFTGDLLMLAGCGAAFEGPIRQMNASLCLMKELPDETMVWPGHEMAVENLELAAYIEPENIRAVLKLVWSISQREQRLCTCPSTIGEEKMYNPFLRTTEPSLLTALDLLVPTEDAQSRLSQDQIAELCFDAIVMKAGEMNQMKKAARQAAAQQRKQEEEERLARRQQSLQPTESSGHHSGPHSGPQSGPQHQQHGQQQFQHPVQNQQGEQQGEHQRNDSEQQFARAIVQQECKNGVRYRAVLVASGPNSCRESEASVNRQPVLT